MKDFGEFVYVIGSNLPSIKIDGKFEQNFYVKWGGGSGSIPEMDSAPSYFKGRIPPVIT